MKSSDLLRHLPSVNDLIENPQVKKVVQRLNESVVTTRVRSFLDELRDEISQRADNLPLPTLREVVDRVTRYVARDENWRLAGVINATGQLRGSAWASAPLADAAVERVLLLSKDYAAIDDGDDVATDVAPDVATDAIDAIRRLTGAEAAALFHSRSGAISLLLSTLANEGAIAVARGDVGEIDPACRLVDLCSAAGARLHEVGSAGSVTPQDYCEALTHGGVALRLAPEDYRVVGGAPRPSTGELAAAIAGGGAASTPLLIEDLAGGPLVDLPGIDGIVGPSAKTALAEGANLVLVRGDGLIGGPECCLVLGDRALVERLAELPLAATQRPRAATAAALAATLELLEDVDRAALKIPILALLSAPLENLQTRAARLAGQIGKSPWVASADCLPLPAELTAVAGLPHAAASVAIAVTPAEEDSQGLAKRLASSVPSVRVRADGEQLLLDLRTVFPRQDLEIVAAFSPEEAAPPSETA